MPHTWVSFSPTCSLHLSPFRNSPICLFTCLPTSPTHPSIYPSSPFCQLAHVNFAFPHCFFWGKVPLLLIKPTALLQYHDSLSLPNTHAYTSTNKIHHILLLPDTDQLPTYRFPSKIKPSYCRCAYMFASGSPSYRNLGMSRIQWRDTRLHTDTHRHTKVWFGRWTAIAPVCQLFGVPWGV